MVPDMLRAAVVWGGTDRHNSRDLFGRFGYGLPSASVSQARRFTVYSRTTLGEPFWKVTIDLDEIAEGKYIDRDTMRVTVPKPVEGEVPAFVTEYAAAQFPDGVDALRTVVVLEKLDEIGFTTAPGLENHLMETFGVTYRNLLRRMVVTVNGKKVEPVDPLFIREDGRFYDLDEDRAEAVEPISFEVRDQETRESLGMVRVRLSVMPPTFAQIDKSKGATKGNQNKRWPILNTHNGLIVLRAGRQIDVVRAGLPTAFVNYDRYIGLEVDFPPALDEWFGVTTSKQQITISPKVLSLLEENGVWATLDQLRHRFQEMRADLVGKFDAPDEVDKRPSERAMEAAAVMDAPAQTSEKQSRQAEENREQAVEVLVEKGVPRPDAERVIETVEKERPFRVEMNSNPEGPFYRVELRGGQVVLLINKAHRFYTDVYASIQGREGARIRQSLEVLLFVLGKAEVYATDERQLFYSAERQEWSKQLNVALAKLGSFVDLDPEALEEVAKVELVEE
jgi:hypothetical protein